MLQLPTNEAGPPPTTATYVDNAVCAGCHPGLNTSYSATGHAVAWPDLMAGFNLPTCEPCHATGAGVPGIFPATGYNVSTNLPTYLQNVTCQTCHGPGSEHVSSMDKADIGLVLNASLCGSCHYSEEGLGAQHHPTYNEWQVAGHNTSQRLPDFIKQPECSNCHEAWNAMQYLETGVYKDVLREADEDAPLTWDIACATCHDSHSTGSGSQLRVPATELCARCHNSGGAQPGVAPHHPMAEMRNNTAGAGIDRTDLDYMESVACVDCHMGTTQAGLPNHTFAPNPLTCFNCHNGSGIFPDPLFTTVEEYQMYIEIIAGAVDEGIVEVGGYVDNASAALNMMAGNRTGENLASWNSEYEIALFNWESVDSDSSSGNHNPGLATALLLDAQDRSLAITDNLTPPDKVTGIVVTDLGNGSIRINWTVSDASDFAKYRIYILTQSKTNITSDTWRTEVTDKTTHSWVVTGLDADSVYHVYVTAVDANGNEITNTVAGVSVTVTSEGGGGLSTTMLALIVLVVVVVIVAVVAMMMRKKKGPAEEMQAEQSPPETPKT